MQMWIIKNYLHPLGKVNKVGKYLDKFKRAGEVGKNVGMKTTENVSNFANKRVNKSNRFNAGKVRDKTVNNNSGMNDFDDGEFEEDYDLDNEDDFQEDYNDDVHVKIAQKPESFHHFILLNKYQDLEKNIRGYKDVFNKDKQEWEVKRKKIHCFTDEQSEDILRTAQSHLSTDIKLTFYSKETFGIRFLAVYDKIEYQFKRMMEYTFGRFGDEQIQGEMKAQAVKIFVDLMTRVEANYLMAIQGMENKRTHDAVHSQESLQSSGEEYGANRRYS